MSKTIHIKASISERLDDDASISEVYGQGLRTLNSFVNSCKGCNYRTKFGVSGLIVLIDTSVEMNNNANYYFEKEKSLHHFTCQYESERRTDNIRAYNGVDMESSEYGNQRDLFKLLEGEDFHNNEVFFNDIKVKSLSEVQEKLIVLAENEAVAFFEENIVDVLNFDDIQEKVIDEFKKYTDFHLFDDKKVEELIYEECEEIIKNAYFNTINSEDDIDFQVSDNHVFYDLVNKALEIVKEEYLVFNKMN